MMNIKILPLSPEHAAIVPYLRKADLDEIALTCDLSPSLAVSFSIAHSDKGFAAFIDDMLCAVFGVDDGIIWLIGTDEISNHPISFYRVSKKIFPLLCEGYDSLCNYVDTRNTLSLRWLQWLGFHVGENINGLHFVSWNRKED